MPSHTTSPALGAGKPILMSAPMVRAILRDVDPKTQTRRVAKFFDVDEAMQFDPRFEDGWWKAAEHGYECKCPYGQPGDRLWVRETFALHPAMKETGHPAVFYRAQGDEILPTNRWKPSIFMPRWASRITLEIESVRVERLQDISEADAIAEGVEPVTSEREIQDFKICPQCGGTGLFTSFINGGACFDTDCSECDTHKKRYRHLWESINGPNSWASSPWVWAITFRRLAKEPK